MSRIPDAGHPVSSRTCWEGPSAQTIVAPTPRTGGRCSSAAWPIHTGRRIRNSVPGGDVAGSVQSTGKAVSWPNASRGLASAAEGEQMAARPAAPPPGGSPDAPQATLVHLPSARTKIVGSCPTSTGLELRLTTRRWIGRPGAGVAPWPKAADVGATSIVRPAAGTSGIPARLPAVNGDAGGSATAVLLGRCCQPQAATTTAAAAISVLVHLGGRAAIRSHHPRRRAVLPQMR